MSRGLKDLSVIEIAELCHEANRAYCVAIGDDSQVAWEDAPGWQQMSAMAGVRAIMADPDQSPSANHESWYAHKEADGWVYGEVKDPDAKPPTHPCMVPYDELPAEQKAKDYIFGAIVRTCI
tara:strand:+ start:6727 stop:7092 length:366 start_codon:yes stop_codon:yes gene_type:complete